MSCRSSIILVYLWLGPLLSIAYFWNAKIYWFAPTIPPLSEIRSSVIIMINYTEKCWCSTRIPLYGRAHQCVFTGDKFSNLPTSQVLLTILLQKTSIVHWKQLEKWCICWHFSWMINLIIAMRDSYDHNGLSIIILTTRNDKCDS